MLNGCAVLSETFLRLLLAQKPARSYLPGQRLLLRLLVALSLVRKSENARKCLAQKAKFLSLAHPRVRAGKCDCAESIDVQEKTHGYSHPWIGSEASNPTKPWQGQSSFDTLVLVSLKGFQLGTKPFGEVSKGQTRRKRTEGKGAKARFVTIAIQKRELLCTQLLQASSSKVLEVQGSHCFFAQA